MSTLIQARGLLGLDALAEAIEREKDPARLAILRDALALERRMATPIHLAIDQTKHLAKPYQPYQWTRVLNSALVDLSSRQADFDGLIVTVPVRHGKSWLCSEWFPTWYLGHHPDDRVILGSHNQDFAAKWSRAVRGHLRECGQELFGIPGISDEHATQTSWDLAGHLGGLIAVGVGNPPTGRGGNLMVIDDPIKKVEQANSRAFRNALWDWWRSDMRTRLEPGGIMLVIMSRWHEDDLVGRLLKQMYGFADDTDIGDDDTAFDRWKVIDMPAIAEPSKEELAQGVDLVTWRDSLGRKEGQALAPERYDEVALKRIKRTVGPYVFNALYQGRPSPPEGGMFPRDKWVIIEPNPEIVAGVDWYLWFDLAGTDAEAVTASDPDWTAACLIGVGPDNLTYIPRVWRCRKEHTDLEAEMLRWITEAKEVYGCTKVRIPQDPGSAGKSYANALVRNVLKVPGVQVKADREAVQGDKVTRAMSLSGQVHGGNVRLFRGPWNAEFIEEAVDFPTGGHDDQVDAAAVGYMEAAGLLKTRSRLIA